MANAVLSVPLPVDVKSEMDKHKEIKWVEVARTAILEKLRILDKIEELLAGSEFTQEDALKHGRKVSRKVFSHHRFTK